MDNHNNTCEINSRTLYRLYIRHRRQARECLFIHRPKSKQERSYRRRCLLINLSIICPCLSCAVSTSEWILALSVACCWLVAVSRATVSGILGIMTVSTGLRL